MIVSKYFLSALCPLILLCTYKKKRKSKISIQPRLLSFPLSVSSRQRCPQAKGLESMAPLVRSVEETPDPIPTTIKGTVPTWINGSFLRNGPGKFEFGKDRYLRNTVKKKNMTKLVEYANYLNSVSFIGTTVSQKHLQKKKYSIDTYQ